MAMILNLGTSTQATPVANEIKVGSIIDALFSGLDDSEKGAAGKDVVDTWIYSTLILLKLPRTDELDVEKVKGLIMRVEEVIGITSVGDSEAGVGVDLDRARWKAIYLLALLFKFLPDDKRGEHVEGLWTRVRTLLEGGELSFMGDYKCCLKPLGMDVSPTGDQRRQTDTVFEAWMGGFPLFQLDEWLLSQMHNRLSLLSPRRWFG